MEASIEGGDDEGCGLEITDNQEVEHWIEIKYESGEISYHEQEGYPDNSEKRTSHGNEMVRQARDHAKWYVAQETEHDTVPWYLDTERLQSVRSAIDDCVDDELRTYFYEFYRQLAGEYDADIVQPHPDPVPARAAMNDYREYKLDIYLTDNGEIEASSGVHVMYYGGVNDEQYIWAEDPYPDRQPDGRLEHVVLDIDWEQFDTFLDYHLRCQIRDSYLSRGEDPPEEYRVLGPGTDHMMTRCMTRDCLPAYHEYDADVDGYRANDTFNAGMFGPLLDLF
ncbi:hypothetical protein C453_00460 [Haloferax elongans ATCC BAA-1513]|uniref:Uncharacterized protein n=1 Tax=Haloferax elongans ATCC BAA-1513 TaxID=1230453 RepID=M0I0N9_HALEO|nr:hypothetical protein [Haloferax elongans]ELZ89502.1 hypothetical protein C453_00460 [Haloferax elongans ATCC BAA-1513]